MKIAVAGCGALGSYYGAMLCRHGQETHFLLRSDYDVVRRDGVAVTTADGAFRVFPNAARHPEEIGVCDLVVIGLKTTANHEFARLLPPLVGDATAVLTLQNGLGNEAPLAALFGAEKILGGLCFVCLNRVAPGRILHIAHGKIVMGEYRRPPQPRTREIAALFQRAGVPCAIAENLEAAHWEKLVWNIPFNGLGVAGCVGYDAVTRGEVPAVEPGDCLTTDKLLSDPRWEKLVRELMAEVIHSAQGLGLHVPDSIAEAQINRTRDMGPYKASTLVDFERGQALELEALFLEPLRQAKRAGVATPRLENLCRVLHHLNPAPGATQPR